ncbi:MAG: hypothetical protein GY847_41880 [Proteobacteria bacterium]|nr:hypothetical protein [Pseudomonadota bacterium]
MKMNQRQFVVFVVLLVLLCACNDESSQSEIYIVADPPSILDGETLSVVLTSSEDFFSGSIDAPLTSEGGLVLQSVDVQDSRTALATFVANASTSPGMHILELAAGDEVGVLNMSVMLPQPGIGQVSSDNAVATAGALGATLSIDGQGTNFDSECGVSVEGADGFQISMVDVVTSGHISVTYDIDIEQKPTTCTVIVTDGMQRYELPFTILSPDAFETQEDDQWLTKGQKGIVILRHPDASMHFGTGFQIDDETVESGVIDVIGETEVHIPVRVPFDFSQDTLSLTAATYNEGGAFLETMNVEVSLFAPAYLGFVPSRLDLDSSEDTHAVDMVTGGVDLLDIESLSIEKNDELFISDWSLESSDLLNVEFLVTSQVEAGVFEITANDGFRDLTALVATTSLGFDTIYGYSGQIAQGDRVYFPVILSSATVTVSTTAVGDDDIEVHGVELIDEGCLVVDLQLANDAEEGLHTLSINNEGDAYYVYVHVEESGI